LIVLTFAFAFRRALPEAAREGSSVNNRSREIGTLFQRMATTNSASPDPAIEDAAARAVQEWPLLALLTRSHVAPAKPVRHMQMAVEAPPSPVASRAIVEVAPEPIPERPPEATPEPAPEAPSRELSPLEQLFLRAERTGKSQSAQPSVFFPAAPPLKAPAAPVQRARQAQLTPPRASAPVPEEVAVTIEPQQRQWRELEAVPERLFERVGGH
jgi:hypothetical protein